MSNTPGTDKCSAGEILLLDGILATIAWTHKRRNSKEFTTLGMIEERLQQLVDRHELKKVANNDD